MLPPRPKDRLTKNQHWAWETLLRSGLCKRLQKHCSPIAIALGCSPEVEGQAYCRRNHAVLDTRLRGSWAATDQKVSSLRTNFCGTRRSHASFQTREATNSPSQLWCQMREATSSPSQLFESFESQKRSVRPDDPKGAAVAHVAQW